MNHITPLHEPLIRKVPLSRLALAPENVRKTPADPIAEAEMKASIAAHGLLENLVVRMDGPADSGAYAVIAGGRRLAAMKALAEDGTIDADHPVPCLVAADPDMAGELSLAENIVRIAMHPADQVIAFSKLADAGLSVGSIAARFGTAERLVEQRLRLGNVAPDLLDAYRAHEIDLEVLKALSVTPDHARPSQPPRPGLSQGGAAHPRRGPRRLRAAALHPPAGAYRLGRGGGREVAAAEARLVQGGPSQHRHRARDQPSKRRPDVDPKIRTRWFFTYAA